MFDRLVDRLERMTNFFIRLERAAIYAGAVLAVLVWVFLLVYAAHLI